MDVTIWFLPKILLVFLLEKRCSANQWELTIVQSLSINLVYWFKKRHTLADASLIAQRTRREATFDYVAVFVAYCPVFVIFHWRCYWTTTTAGADSASETTFCSPRERAGYSWLMKSSKYNGRCCFCCCICGGRTNELKFLFFVCSPCPFVRLPTADAVGKGFSTRRIHSRPS